MRIRNSDLYDRNVIRTSNTNTNRTIPMPYKERSKQLASADWEEVHRINKNTGCIFSVGLFNQCSKRILRELQDIPGFIIRKYNLEIGRWLCDDDWHRRKIERILK